MACLRKLIFASVSKATEIKKEVTAMFRKCVHCIPGENCSSKVKKILQKKKKSFEQKRHQLSF